MAQGTFPSSLTQRTPGLLSIVYFTSSGTFTKADYPGAQSVRVMAVGSGGGGGGAESTTAGQASAGDGGGGGSYAESLLDIGELATSETVTIGTGGTGGTGASNGSDGGSTSFGSHVVAVGGRGGAHSVASGSDLVFIGDGGNAGLSSSNTGDVVRDGGPGGGRFIARGNTYYAPRARGGDGGSSVFGEGVAGHSSGSGSGNGNNGKSYGGGGSGAAAAASSAQGVGGTGANGIVIVEVYSTYKGGDTNQFATRDYVDGEDWVNVNGGVGYQNGWEDFSTSGWDGAAYRLRGNGLVILAGLIHNGSNGVIFTLPESHRPARQYLFWIASSDGGNRVDVYPSGNVEVMGYTGTYLSLDGIQFTVD